jgi:tetratricopeptide (TPR) repeat protein
MKNSDNDNPRQFSQEDLLRFLDSGPRLVRTATSAKLAEESSCFEASECPTAESYIQLATGAIEGDAAEKLLAHAAACDVCGDLLASSLGALEGNPSAEEIAAIAELATAQADWQESLSQRLAATKAQRRPKFASSNWWMGAAGVAAVVLVAAGAFLWQKETHNPERQLAMAYEMSRTLELRVPDAGYAQFSSAIHTRGNATDREPAPLLDARARLARELEKSPQDAHWLELQARADMLEERYDSAIDVLDRLLAEGPVTPELLTDAASAYYQRGLVTGNELDRSTALDDLARADKLSPADPVILFNEAIVMEDRGQMMNAVEVWNRFITVERDAKWRTEGQRKLEALEQTLSRLKSHESRVRQMLATPEAMLALAGDKKTLAALDEELSVYKLDKLLLVAFPESGDGANSGAEQARGSPDLKNCPKACLAARRLLHAIGTSLELEHHDSWLIDLLPPDIDAFPAAVMASYGHGLRLLAQAMQDDVSALPVEGVQFACQARAAFQQPLRSNLPAAQETELRVAEHVAERRATLENLFALQLHANLDECRTLAGQLRGAPQAERDDRRYPWMAAQERVTEEICERTPETRAMGLALAEKGKRIANLDEYRLLKARATQMIAGELQDSGDAEAAEKFQIMSIRELYAGDPPAARITPALGHIARLELAIGHSHMSELTYLEDLQYTQLTGLKVQAAEVRLNLARAQLRNGEPHEAEQQLRLANSEGSPAALGKSEGADLSMGAEMLASTMLESGDLSSADRYLNEAEKPLMHTSDIYIEREDAMNRGQLELALGHPDRSANVLESAIRLSEGSDVRRGDRVTGAEFGGEDHDAYAELAAAWLAQGRSPEQVLAVWERFRLRSRGLPITQCEGGSLDCELPRLLAEQHRLGDNVVMGQIVLLDRVLIYRMDANGIHWSERRGPRQGLLDAAQRLEQAVSSPHTSAETAARLGAGLADKLLPSLPTGLPGVGALLLEPDPLLANLCWPVLPTEVGPLGIAYPLAEMRSILVPDSERSVSHGTRLGERALVVGASMTAGGEPPLPEALSEATHVDRLLHAPAILLGEQATAARVGAGLSSATIFHFAGHAVPTENGTELLLAAASSGDIRPWVDGKFLQQHPPRACRLAVLSACATGKRELAWNHPLQSMVETLGSLGVPEVVATRWQIDSEASVPLIDTFYAGLAKGETAAMALTSARRVQFSNSSYRNPYYWGAYYVTGRELVPPLGDLHAHR